MLSDIPPTKWSVYVDEIIGDHQYGFRRNRSTTDQIFCIRQILEKKQEYNDSVRREILYRILIEFRVPIKLVRLIKICLNDTYSPYR
jgi:hypothetical protein